VPGLMAIGEAGMCFGCMAPTGSAPTACSISSSRPGGSATRAELISREPARASQWSLAEAALSPLRPDPQ